jgi:hypothetical protein
LDSNLLRGRELRLATRGPRRKKPRRTSKILEIPNWLCGFD